MGWVSINNQSDDDRPRRLTADQIEQIISVIPIPKAATRDAAKLAHERILHRFRKELRTCELAPSAIPELRRRILQAHIKAQMPAGTPVGINGGESISSSATQSTLNTFHQSGSDMSSIFSIDTLKDLIYASKNPKNPFVTVHFINKFITYEQALTSRSFITGSFAFDFVSDYEIAAPNELQYYWWHNLYRYPDYPRMKKMFKVPQFPPTRTTRILRLHLNLVEMYKQRVTIDMLAQAMYKQDEVYPVYGPMSAGIIDLYGETKEQSDPLQQVLYDEDFITKSIIKVLKELRIKGVSGITKIQPTIIPLISFVRNEELLTHDDCESMTPEQAVRIQPLIGSVFKVHHDTYGLRSKGVTVENLIVLYQLAGLKVLGKTPDLVLVQIPPTEMVANSDVKPTNIVNLAIDTAYKNWIDQRDTLIRQRIQDGTINTDPVDIPRPQILQAAEFIVVQCQGSNLRDVLALPGVDQTRTICNNMHEIANVIGIEASSDFIIHEFHRATKSAGRVAPEYLTFFAILLTSRGVPYGANFTGISQQPTGHGSLATVERAGEVFTKHALYGKPEDARNTSAAIILGTSISLGSGYFDVGMDIVEDGQPVTLLNEDVNRAYNRDDSYKRVMLTRTAQQADISSTLDEELMQLDFVAGTDGDDDKVNLLQMTFDATDKPQDSIESTLDFIVKSNKLDLNLPPDIISRPVYRPESSGIVSNIPPVIPVDIDTTALIDLINRYR